MNKAKRRGARRMIHASICGSDKFNSLSCDQARLLYLLIYPHTDDFGRFEAWPVSIKMHACPGLDWSHAQIAEWTAELSSITLIRCYQDDRGRVYGEIVDFELFQQFSREREAKYPEPQGFIDNQHLECLLLPNNQPKLKGTELKGRELNESIPPEAGSDKPTLTDLVPLNLPPADHPGALGLLKAAPKLSDFPLDKEGYPEACLDIIRGMIALHKKHGGAVNLLKALNYYLKDAASPLLICAAVRRLNAMPEPPKSWYAYWKSIMGNPEILRREWEENIWPAVKMGGVKWQ